MPPVISSSRAPPPGVAPKTGGEAVASMGRGASRGREQRDVQIYTRPSAEFVKLGKYLQVFSSCRFNYFLIFREDWQSYSSDV